MENNIKITGSVKVNGASFKGAVNADKNIDGCVAERGVAGFSPIANVVTNGDDVTITITDYKGSTTATIPDMSDEVERIEALIPNTASPTNKLVDTATLNSSVQTATSNFRGDWATYADIPSDVSLYPVDATGVRTPSTNDYLVVVADEEQNGGTWRYKYVGLWSVDGKNGWQAEYQVNETPFTADQLAAINSGITPELVEEIGQSGGSLDNKITNCLLEVPQRIKYTLEDGTFTLKAGSVVIVPYGVEDLTAQYPVGSTFINENFKVADTQWYGGKFFVWAEVVEDMVNSAATTDTNTRTLYLTLNDNLIRAQFYSGSGAEEYTGTKSYLWYRTDENLTKRYSSGTLTTSVCSLPIGTCTANGTVYIGSIDQFFNGIGYIGSTIWADKDIKGLIPNGRNEDGSLKNIEFTTPSIIISTQTGENRNFVGLGRNSETNYFLYRGVSANYKYDNEKNINIDVPNNTQWNILPIGYTTGDITSFDFKQPFRALDYNDYISGVGSTAAYIVETYVNGTSGYRIWSDGYCEQWGSIAGVNSGYGTVTLIISFKNINYTITTSYESSLSNMPNSVSIGYYNKTINSFKLGSRFMQVNETPAYISWRACGYIS